MSATTQPTTFSDLYTDLENRMREATGITATENQAKRYINTALQDMHLGFGEKFWWAHRDAVLRTQDDYTTGTVAITKGSTTVTGTSTAWNTANAFSVNNVRAGGKIVVSGGFEVYEVSSIASDTSLTLTTDFVNTTVTAATYTYFEDDYALDSDFLRPLDIYRFSIPANVEILSAPMFDRRFPRRTSVGRPSFACFVTKNPSGDVNLRRRVRLFKAPNDFYLIPYKFVTNKLAVSSAGVLATALSADADEPIVPLQYRHAIVLHAAHAWYRDKKDDARGQEVWAEYIDTVSRVVADAEIGAARPQIQPRVSSYVNSARKPWRQGASGRYVTGDAFDQMR